MPILSQLAIVAATAAAHELARAIVARLVVRRLGDKVAHGRVWTADRRDPRT